MPTFASDDSGSDFESAADPAHASGGPSTEHQHAARAEEVCPTGRPEIDRENLGNGAGRHEADAGGASKDARRNDAEEAEEEITPEMIEAGVAEFQLSRDPVDGVFDDTESIVTSIFAAMLSRSRYLSNRPK
jgi:hypothetical protein